MCRISGGYDYDSIKRLLAVSSMTEKQHNGGPDSLAVKTINDVTFGHNRLSIIDLSEGGNQPQRTDRYLLTYNGEIYNYKEVSFNSRNDTQALLTSINSIGLDSTLPLLNGMFAFGVYDRYLNQIKCVVDRLGQKPLYYYHSGNAFYFASWPAALYDLEPSWEINQQALTSYWMLGSVMGTDSIFKGIKKLTAGQVLTYDIETNQLTINQYWQPKFQENTTGIEDLIFDAIDKVKISDVSIHIFLSGGIDSTLVASRFANGQAVHLDSPERHYAQTVADKYKINLKVINPTKISVSDSLIDYSRQSGEPTMAGLIPYITAKEVSKHGKVAITANGADEIFFGYNRTSENVTQAQINHIFRTPLGPYELSINNIDKRFGDGRFLELKSYIEYDLNKTLDSASMCHGLEVRAPFLDHRLVEMALSIHEKQHRTKGNKTILKQMLWKMGFNKDFTDRPKQGFSLHYQPQNLNELVNFAFKWVQQNGYLSIKKSTITDRDTKYLEMAALGFYYWHITWQHKIK